MHRRPSATGALAAAVSLALVACGGGRIAEVARTPAPTGTAAEALSGDIADPVLREAAVDLHDWWSRASPGIYPRGEYSAPELGVWALGPGDDTGLDCDGLAIDHRLVEGNAMYLFCDALVFDLDLIRGFATNNGEFAVAMVAAHEWGHMVQRKGGEPDDTPSVLSELQADCFAGAWTAKVIETGEPFDLDGGDLDAALGALLAVRDPVGSAADDEAAHGSAFDRVSAFNAGMGDVRDCLDYVDDPPAIFEAPFETAEDAATGGNLALDQIIGILTADLDTFFTTEVDPEYRLPGAPVEDDCDGERRAATYCASSGRLVVDVARLRAVHEAFGDFATVMLFAWGYADAGGIEADEANCVTGAFVRALFLNRAEGGDRYNLSPSPGDLDEGVEVFLAMSRDGDGIASVGELRSGLVGGLDAC